MNTLSTIKAYYQRHEAKLYLAAFTLGSISQAHADDTLDMDKASAQLGLGLAAIGALGAAKLAPAALTWVWGLVTRYAQR